MRQQKLFKAGNSTAVALAPDLLEELQMDRGDLVTVRKADDHIEIRKAASDDYNEAMSCGRAFAARYRRTMKALAK